MARRAYRERGPAPRPRPAGEVERSSASLTEASAVLDELRHALGRGYGLVGEAVEALRSRKSDLSPEGLRLLERAEESMTGIHRLFHDSGELVLELRAIAEAVRG